MPDEFDPAVADKQFSPPKGLTDTRLFSESLSDEEARITRVETAVQRLRDDVDEVMPSIRQLVAIEDEIEDLVGQLKTLIDAPPSVSSLVDSRAATASSSGNTPETPSEASVESQNAPINLTLPDKAPVSPSPAAKPAPTVKTSSFSPPASTGNAVIRNLRVADHANKTRIVLDSASKTDISVDFDAGENLLVINTTAPSVGINTAAATRGSKNVEDISVVEIKSGHEIIIGLKKGTSVSKVTHIAPNKNSRDHRAYFDIMF